MPVEGSMKENGRMKELALSHFHCVLLTKENPKVSSGLSVMSRRHLLIEGATKSYFRSAWKEAAVMNWGNFGH